ncbi:MAG: creatininase family protein [Anaerolineales bacterium]|nr:creatininase family protein [Anaerolineales bacterium]
MDTHLFHFDELTWPEVAALPRHTPLVLPLGDGYDLASLPSRLDHPPRIGLLPALPFGWIGSRLAVPPPIFLATLRGLLANLLEDGFTSATLLTPPDMDLESGMPHLGLSSRPQESGFFSPDDHEKVVLLPIGHTEQHGYHAPLNTDTLIIEAIARGTASRVPDQAVCLPVTPYGVSMHRRSFAGTFNIGGRAFEDFWLAVIDELVARGCTRIYLLSGHGGNCSFLTNVVKYAGERHPRTFCATSYLYLSGPQGVAALEQRRQSPIGGMGHACELETSLVLHLRPELIHLERAVDETNFITTPAYSMDWIEGGALVANPPWEDDTRTGAYGAGSLGTAKKGEFWLTAAIDEKVDHVAEIHAQYHRRRARRSEH